MKVFMIMPHPDQSDYLSANLMHGLTELDDVELYVYEHFEWMLEGCDISITTAMYGMGYTYAGRAKKERIIEITESDATEKIKGHFFDVVIYGEIHRNKDFLDLVLGNYKPNEVVFVDGEDYDGVVRLSHVPKELGFAIIMIIAFLSLVNVCGFITRNQQRHFSQLI